MSVRTKYRTKQKNLLIGYLETIPGVHFTANDICSYFEEQGIDISQATIYRQLENLVDEGLVSKYTIDTNTPACFEYIGEEDERDNCIHCKCEVCGKLIHMHCDELDHIREHLLLEHEFSLSLRRTVFYGLCNTCITAAGSR